MIVVSRVPLFSYLAFLGAIAGCTSPEVPPEAAAAASPQLAVTDLGKTYSRNPDRTPDYLFYDSADKGGSTSVRRTTRDHLKWKHQGYFQRNRELGQVFNVPAGDTITLDAIVLRTGNSASAVLENTAGAGLYLQLFEVIGTPVIDDNGTPAGTESTHGYTDNHRADDHLRGVTYNSLLVAGGGTFPDLPPTGKNGGESGHLRYLRWDLLGDGELTLAGGKRYAFLVGFAEPGPGQGFTLGNNNLAADPAAPALRTDPNGWAWWGIRREGDGTLPPTRYPGERPPADPEQLTSLQDESLYVPDHPLTLAPTTDGFPDVDTYRCFEFYVEVNSRPTE